MGTSKRHDGRRGTTGKAEVGMAGRRARSLTTNTRTVSCDVRDELGHGATAFSRPSATRSSPATASCDSFSSYCCSDDADAMRHGNVTWTGIRLVRFLACAALSPSLKATRITASEATKTLSACGLNHVGCAPPRSVTTVTNGSSRLQTKKPTGKWQRQQWRRMRSVGTKSRPKFSGLTWNNGGVHE